MRITEIILVYNTDMSAMANEVNELTKKGFQPFGNMVSHEKSLVREMVKYVEDDKTDMLNHIAELILALKDVAPNHHVLKKGRNYNYHD